MDRLGDLIRKVEEVGLNAGVAQLTAEAGDDGQLAAAILAEADHIALSVERQHFYNFLPEEIWRLVMARLDKPSDIQNCLLASIFLRSVLDKGQPQQALFRQVYQILTKQRFFELRRYQDDQKRALWSDFGALRATCKTWYRSMDTCLQEMPEMPLLMTKFYFQVSGNIPEVPLAQRFIDHFEATHQGTDACPFATRAAEIVWLSRTPAGEVTPAQFLQNEQRHNASLAQLFSLYGTHLKLVCLVGSGSPGSFDNFLQLQNLLRLAPNISSLMLVDMNDTGLEEHRLQINFPLMQNLRSVMLYLVHPLIANALIRANPHLEQIDMYVPLEVNILDYRQLYNRALTQLKMLKISGSVTPTSLFRLLNMPGADWPLLQSFDFGAFRGNTEQEHEHVFGLLNRKWGDSLTNLSVSFPGIQEWLIPDLRLNKLKEIRVEWEGYQNLEFLVQLASTLETVTVSGSIWSDADTELQKAIERERGLSLKLYSFMDNPLGSNVWTLLPKLKKIGVRFQMESWMGRQTNMFWKFNRAQWLWWKDHANN